MRILTLGLILLCAACHSQSQEWPPWPPNSGPLDVSHPPIDVPLYIVDLKPGFDQLTYAKAISKKVKGKVGTVYQNFTAFTIYDISEATVAKIRAMSEVESVQKSTIMHID